MLANLNVPAGGSVVGFERLRSDSARSRLVELPVTLAIRGTAGPPPAR